MTTIGRDTDPTAAQHRRPCIFSMAICFLGRAGLRKWYLCLQQRQNFIPLYSRGCLEFILKVKVHHEALVDNSARKSLANKRGTGKIRHLSSQLLWIQERTADGSLVVPQVCTMINTLGTIPLAAVRIRSLLFLLGFVDSEDGRPIGQTEYEEMIERSASSRTVKQMANLMLRIRAVGGLQGIDRLR